MNPNIIRVILITVLLAVSITECRRRKFCKPGRKYYDPVRNRCRQCRPCADGETKNLSQPISVSEIYGAMECYPCVGCPVGQFSNYDQTQLICVHCSRNCTEEGRWTKSNCNGINDAACGDCLPMYYALISSGNSGPCLRCSVLSAYKPECLKYARKMSSSGIPSSSTPPIITTSNLSTEGTHVGSLLEKMNVSVFIIVIAVCVAVFIGILYCIYKGVKLICFKARGDNFGTASTVVLDSSVERIKAERKTLLEEDLVIDGAPFESAKYQLKDDQQKVLLQKGDVYLRLTCRYIDKPADELFEILEIDDGIKFQAQQRYPDDHLYMLLSVLDSWVAKYVEKATLGCLFDALSQGRYNLACSKIYEHLQTQTQKLQENKTKTSYTSIESVV